MMRSVFIIFCLLLFKSTICFSQGLGKSFHLIGNISSLDTGEVLFKLVADSNYYPNELRHLKAKIINGKFSLEGFIPQPMAYEVSLNNIDFSSELFVIDTGKQTIDINYKINKSIPKISNHIMKYDLVNYFKSFKKVEFNRMLLDKKWDSLASIYSNKIPTKVQENLEAELRKNYRENDNTLLIHVEKNPNSYYALWRLIRLSKFGYEDSFNKINSQFSDSLKNSAIGKQFKIYLDEFNFMALSKKLVFFKNSIFFQSAPFFIDYESNDFTLLDFWYSGCGPCISQFKEMSSIYDSFHPNGFQIIGVSTDKMNKKEIWLKTIKDHKLKWPQLLDDNGIESLKLGINVFPSNILINNKGQVIGINILPTELSFFLCKNIKKL